MTSSPLPSCSLLALVLLCGGASGARDLVQDRASIAPKSLPSFRAICGKAEIWTLLTADAAVQGVQNIKWAKIMAIVDQQLEAFGHSLRVHSEKIGFLRSRLADAEAHEQVRAVSQADVDELLAKALGVFGGGVEGARSAQCGSPRAPKEHKVRRGLRRSVEAFAPIAESFCEEEVRFEDHLLFVRTCKAGLGEDRYCAELCQRLQDTLVAAAGKHHGTAADAVRTELDRALEELAAAQEKQNHCLQAKEGLQEFWTSLQNRSVAAGHRHSEYRDAEYALEDARGSLDDIEASVQEADEQLAETLQTLSGHNEAVEAVTKDLADIQTQEGELKDKVEASDVALVNVQEKLRAVKLADEIVEKLRDAVSVTTLRMRDYFEAAALEPALQMLSTRTNLDQYFYGDLAAVPAAGDMGTAVDRLDKFCKDEAMPAFSKVKAVDLSPLCKLGGGVDEIEQSLHKSVGNTIRMVRDSLEHVKSWMDPYKGQSYEGQDSITAEVAEKLVGYGEPKGLREIMGVYSLSKFYQYLQGWKYRGPFLAKMALLRDAKQALTDAMQALQTELAGLKDKAQATLVSRKKVEEDLEAAKATQGITSVQKAKLEAAVALMQGQAAKMHRSLDDLHERVQTAWKKYEWAHAAMHDLHAEGTASQLELDALLEEGRSLLQSGAREEVLRKYEEEVQKFEASRKQARLVNELEAARAEYEALQEQIAMVKNP